jgi:hypothetical protein
MQHPVIGHDEAKSAVTFREMRINRHPSQKCAVFRGALEAT